MGDYGPSKALGATIEALSGGFGHLNSVYVYGVCGGYFALALLASSSASCLSLVEGK